MQSSAKGGWVSGLDVLHTQQTVWSKISSGCASIDHILGGGIRSHEITEFCGMPGSGKTQLGIQIAVTVQLPVEFGGAGGSCVIVDTEGSVRATRVLQVAEQRLAHFSAHLPEGQVMPMTAKDLVAGVQRCRVYDADQLVAACVALAAEVPPQVKAVVVDSVAAPFRAVEGIQFQHQPVMLATIARMLRKIAARGIMVVVLNQVVGGPTGGNNDVKPALGPPWSPQPTHRVLLTIQDSMRKARLLKSNSLPADEVTFTISDVGMTG